MTAVTLNASPLLLGQISAMVENRKYNSVWYSVNLERKISRTVFLFVAS